jgi:hypothetical protein
MLVLASVWNICRHPSSVELEPRPRHICHATFSESTCRRPTRGGGARGSASLDTALAIRDDVQAPKAESLAWWKRGVDIKNTTAKANAAFGGSTVSSSATSGMGHFEAGKTRMILPHLVCQLSRCSLHTIRQALWLTVDVTGADPV